ncbi:MAG: DUF3108 domain-containing protein [Candidatus Omnitrophica bacterium]|nr:DUF3108 domain-containing protein [Candidatus Omnitrophota bacterium]HOX53864.1 DUF3108 domain-containing protein [Candidatus Omnitrophota bacterium]
MKPSRKILVTILIFLILINIILVLYNSRNYFKETLNKGYDFSKTKIKFLAPETKSLPFKNGEEFVYRIDMGFIPLGRARLSFGGKIKIKGQDLYLIKFKTNTVNFKDTETIYAQPDTFLPVRIERDINMWGVSSKIVEEYNQKEKSVKITKTELGKTNVQTINSDSELQNVICMIYYYRLDNNIELGKTVNINLPLKKIAVEAKEIRKVKLPKGKFEAFILESVPGGYDLWFDTGKNRIPLKITGAITFGNAALVLLDFN